MLKDRSSGTLNVACDILITGQREICRDATTLSLYYLSIPEVDPSELQAASLVIRDFGTDEQFRQLLGEIRSSQYHDQPRYDKLWRNLLWSNSDRERDVLEIYLRMIGCTSHTRAIAISLAANRPGFKTLIKQ